jgi:DNA repair exonuclease SbcCD ATPase subunit
MITFVRLIIENFRTFKGAYTIELENQGLVFIVGENEVSKMADSNGAGKTGILDAICMVLYKKMLRAGTPVNWNSDFGALQLLFRVDKKEYCAKWEQAEKKTIWQVSEVIDGIPKNPKPGEQIEQFIGLSFNAFVSTIMFGTSSDRFAEQSDAPRKKMFDDLLDTTFFIGKRKFVEEELTQLQGRYDDLEREYVKFEERKATLLDERERYGKDNSEIELDAYREWAADHDLLIDLHQSLNKLFPVLVKARGEVDAEQELVDESTRLAAIRNRLDQRLSDVDNRVRSLLRELDDVNQSKVCPVCRRPIDDVRVVARSFQDKIDPLLDLHRQYRRYQNDIREILDYWPAITGGGYEKLREEFKALVDRIRDLETGMSQMQEARFMRQAVDEISERIEKTTRDLELLTAQMDALKSEIHLREFWVEGFGNRGLKAMLIRDYEDFLNEHLETYTQLITASEFKLSFRAQRQLKSGDVRDEIGFTIENREGKIVDYDDLSDGERQRVDLCVVLALQDLVRDLHRGRFSLALYDEIFDHLDDTGCEQVMDYLTKQRREYGSVFVISHSPKLLAYPSDHVIRVVKTEKGSAINAS